MTPDNDRSRPAPDIIEPGVPATSEMPRNIPPGSEDEEEPPPLDMPQAATDWGTTEREQRLDEPLWRRTKREQPDRPARADGAAAGRIVEPSADDVGFSDDEPDEVAELDSEPYDLPSAEEAAVRVTDDPPGLNYDPDPGYVDPD